MLLPLVSGSWACSEMYNQNNTEHHKSSARAPPPMMMSPRISFSNDFAESQSQQLRAAAAYRDAPVSSDFEFSVSNYSMMSADELFSKGRLLPLKDSCSSSSNSKTTTLRDELLNNEDAAGFASRPPKNPRWRGFLGLRKSKSEKPIDKTPPAFHHHHDKNSQDYVD